ncbi:MAG TPA: AAA family ATPase [Vicinamibacterales bacterium]
MRPLRLEVEGFTCYRDRPPALDFTDLTLFAIAGPTGAGKSSILDTMLYALYGQVPRLGKQGITEAISHGRDSLSVLLDFAVQGRHYRVARRVKRRAKSGLQTTATFAEVVDGLERSIADGVRDVNAAIQKVLGLSYDDFIQTVILPQGEFARFLRAEPKSQREILQNLLRHGIFERMRRTAEEQKSELNARLRGVEGQIETYKDATEEALAEREAALTDAQTRLSAAIVEKDAANTELETVRELHKLTTEVLEQRKQRLELESQAPTIKQIRIELDHARRAAEIQPRLEALHQAEHRSASATREREKAADHLKEAEADRREKAMRLESAAGAAAACDELSVRLRRLDEISGDIKRRAELTAQLQALPQQLEIVEQELEKAKSEEASARKDVKAHEVRAAKLKAQREALQFDEPLHDALASVRDAFAEAKSLQRERDAATADAERAALAEADAAQKESTAQSAYDAARTRAESSAAALQSAREAREDARNRHRAAALRAHLHAGDNCPVCLQIVATPPPAEAPPELKKLDTAYAAAETRAQDAERDRLKAQEALAVASARRAEVARTTREAEVRAADRTTAVAAALEGLAAAVAGVAAVGQAELLQWMDARWSELQQVKVQRDRIDASLRNTDGELAAAQITLATAAAAASQADERRNRIVQDHDRLQTERAEVIARIEAVTTHPDPGAEREEIQQRIARLREEEAAAREAHVQAELAVRSAEERLKAADSTRAQAAADLQAAGDAVAGALTEAGLAGFAAAKAAARTTSQQRALEQRAADFDKKLAAVLQRLADLEPRISGRETSDAALKIVQERAALAATNWRAADQAVTTLDAECKRLQQAVQKRRELLDEQAEVQGRLALTAELATDLRGDRFQEYLLEEAFKALVAGASVRMKAISNRYTLEWEAGEFYVVDHDNAGERRRAETLSGGETFMASLCLALQLSEEVLRTSGALQMDSLFIDEGFGTLDADSLTEVTDAIEALRHEGGRLIGVISHRPELTDRLPGCIRVIKGVGESTWTLERAG